MERLLIDEQGTGCASEVACVAVHIFFRILNMKNENAHLHSANHACNSVAPVVSSTSDYFPFIVVVCATTHEDLTDALNRR